MASAPDTGDDVFDKFLENRGHETEPGGWERENNKLQRPECRVLQDESATECKCCGWTP
jgi:hypothetical protein